MKRILSVILALLLLFSCSVAEEKMIAIPFGNYQYFLPDSWEHNIPEGGGYNYHYETGSAMTGFYLMAEAYEEITTPSMIESYFDIFTDGILGSGDYSNFEAISTLHCDAIGPLPYRAFSAVLNLNDVIIETIYFMWSDWEYVYSFVASDPTLSLSELESELQDILSNIKLKEPEPLPNSRKNPALVGQPVSINASRSGLDYTMEVTVDEVYRGSDYQELLGRDAKTGGENTEYIAVKVTVKFESINSIQPNVLGTDDPELRVDAIWNFRSYSSSGTKYDNLHYPVYNMSELTNVFEGAATTGYFQFEVNKSDHAPLLVYEPENGQRIWISLQ